MRVILATDHPDLRISLELFLSEQPGVTIVGTASEGDGLFALIQSSKPDLIMTDWDLPGRSVPSILSAAKRLPKSPKTIILANEVGDCSAAMTAGADAAVLKGSPPDFLLKTFNEVRKKPAEGGIKV